MDEDRDLPTQPNPIFAQDPVQPVEDRKGSVWDSRWFAGWVWMAGAATGVLLVLIVVTRTDTREDRVILPSVPPVTVTSLRTVMSGGTPHVVTERAVRTPEVGEVVPTSGPIPDPTGPAGGSGVP